MLALIAVLLLSGQTAGPDPCADPANCRVVRDFELRAPDGRRVPVRTGERRTPWIVQDNVLLTPGESLTVRFERDGDVLRPRRVRTGAQSAAAAPAAGEVKLSFAQAADGALTLTAESRADTAVEYTAVLANMARQGPQTPPVCPLAAGATTVERWSAPIVSLTLASFRPSASGECRARAAQPAPAAAEARLEQGRLSLPLGRSVTLRLEGSGAAVRPTIVTSVPAAEPMREALMAAVAEQGAALQRRTGDQETLTALTGPPGPPPARDQVRLTFDRGPDGRTVLLIAENGYGRVLDYRARMRLADGRSSSTTICRVPAGLRMGESWSDPITVLELSDFELLNPGRSGPDDARVCD